MNPGSPGATSTSTRMNRPARPWSVADGTMASTRRTLRAGAHLAGQPPLTPDLSLGPDLADANRLRDRDRLVDRAGEMEQ